MDVFRYDFDYGWLWNYGHLIPVVIFGALAALAWRRSWPRWLALVSTLGALWGLVGLWIVQVVMGMNLPMELPTERFLPGGSGRVLDVGAGSGRTSLMVLGARPQSRVLALDLYDGYFGIVDNTPERLFDNAARAGARDRIDALTGDMRDMPLPDGSFDAAVSAFAIDHLSREAMTEALSEVRRVLAPGGEFLLVVVNPDGWIRTAYPFFAHHGYFGSRADQDRWRRALERAGFAVVEQGTTPGALYLLANTPEPPAAAITDSTGSR